MINPLVSVIVPCYNQAEFLSQTLESVLNQSWHNWECIIVNDGSIDETEKIALEWCSQDNRFLYFKQKNSGVSVARNNGLKQAKGDYYQFLDGDDIIRNDKFKLSLDLANSEEESILVISNFKMFTNNLKNESEPYCKLIPSEFNYVSFLKKWDVEFTIPIHCGFFDRRSLDGFLFNENLSGREDWFMWLYAIKNSTKNIFIDEPLALYRKNSSGATKQYLMMQQNFIAANKVIYEMLDQEGKQIIFNKILDIYSIESLKNAKVIEMGLDLQNFIEIETGKKRLGFVGAFFYRFLRKVGNTIIKGKNNT